MTDPVLHSGASAGRAKGPPAAPSPAHCPTAAPPGCPLFVSLTRYPSGRHRFRKSPCRVPRDPSPWPGLSVPLGNALVLDGSSPGISAGTSGGYPVAFRCLCLPPSGPCGSPLGAASADGRGSKPAHGGDAGLPSPAAESEAFLDPSGSSRGRASSGAGGQGDTVGLLTDVWGSPVTCWPAGSCPAHADSDAVE